MKAILNHLNFAIAAIGLVLVYRLTVSYDDPIPVGVLWILLVCAKCFMEVFRK